MRASATRHFVKLLRDAASPPRFTDAETWPNIADLTGDVVYARLQRGDDTLEAAYPPKALDAWAERARLWAKGGAPSDLPLVDAAHRSPRPSPRDVFIYFIHEGKLAPRRSHGADRAARLTRVDKPLFYPGNLPPPHRLETFD